MPPHLLIITISISVKKSGARSRLRLIAIAQRLDFTRATTDHGGSDREATTSLDCICAVFQPSCSAPGRGEYVIFAIIPFSFSFFFIFVVLFDFWLAKVATG